MKDICLLKYNDLSENTIQFRRANTINTNRNSKPISVGYSDQLKRIIESWGNKPVQPDAFIFPVLQPDLMKKGLKKSLPK